MQTLTERRRSIGEIHLSERFLQGWTDSENQLVEQVDTLRVFYDKQVMLANFCAVPIGPGLVWMCRCFCLHNYNFYVHVLSGDQKMYEAELLVHRCNMSSGKYAVPSNCTCGRKFVYWLTASYSPIRNRSPIFFASKSKQSSISSTERAKCSLHLKKCCFEADGRNTSNSNKRL